MITVKINGKVTNIGQDVRTVWDVIQKEGLTPDEVVVEYNLQVLPRDSWGITNLKEGDSLEILSFVGGG
ncbi:MAG: sulfur carrier protein ThiS [Syntrophales bacterium]|nr:sulfur carrier protein ThiS [Syntrophales bacterium]